MSNPIECVDTAPILGRDLFCYARGLDPEMFRYARRPCPFLPGSPEKIEVLRLRCALRLPLFVQGDFTDAFALRRKQRWE